MSYILDALQKAEKQRELGQVPGLDSVHEPVTQRPVRHWSWVLAGGVVLGVLAVVALYAFLSDMRIPVNDSASARPDALVQPPLVVRADKPVGERPPVPDTEPSPGRASAQPVEASPAPVSPPSVATDASLGQPGKDRDPQFAPSATIVADVKPLKPLPLPASKPAPVAAQAPPSKPEPESEPARQADPRPAPPVDRPATVSPAPSPRRPPPAVPKDEELPVWPLVSPETYRSINARLNVDVHVYSKVREKRFVFVNMKIYHEGDQLLEGPELEKITPDGVVLSYRGERFRVPAR